MSCFKTAWFAKVARKAHITDTELLRVAEQVMQGQAVDLGGGVFKKRLNRNDHRPPPVALAYMPRRQVACINQPGGLPLIFSGSVATAREIALGEIVVAAQGVVYLLVYPHIVA